MPRRRRVNTIGGLPDDLVDLISGHDPEPVRENLGNFPDRPPPARSAPAAARTTQPEPAAAADPTGDDPQHVARDADDADPVEILSDPQPDEDGRRERPSDDRTDVGLGDDPGDERRRDRHSVRELELEERLAAQDRELDLVRRGNDDARRQQALAATSITEENILPFRVSAQDMQVLATDPERGAQMMNTMLTRMGMHLGQALLTRGMALIQADRQVRDERETVRNRFWSDNQDLVPHQVVLRGYMQDVQAEGGRTEAQVLQEAAVRTRRYAGLDRPGRRAAAPAGGEGDLATGARRSGIRPAAAERGGHRGNGATTLSGVEREILELARM